MIESFHTLFYKLRFFFVGALVLTNIFLLTLLLQAMLSGTNKQTQNESQSVTFSYVSDDPNAITRGLSRTASELERTVHVIENNVASGLTNIGETASNTGQYVQASAVSSGKFIGSVIHSAGTLVSHTARNTTNFIVSSVVHSTRFVSSFVGTCIGVFFNNPVVSAAIQPTPKGGAPTIDTYAPMPVTSVAGTTPMKPAAVQPVVQQAVAQNAPTAATVWPMHGEITTLFGVPHWPWQPTHTGLDISSGRSSGATGVKPIRNGVVIETVRAYWGLGNYVTVDHGSGLTSVYAHLASISVQVGQQVDTNTVLGFEGSTGASTGTHLHLEIRQHGKPVDPQHYLGSRP